MFARSSAPYVSANFFSTGGRIAEDGPLTYSPTLFSFSTTSLDVVPYFLARSETLVLATVVPSGCKHQGVKQPF
jgi:hypothetical protein